MCKEILTTCTLPFNIRSDAHVNVWEESGNTRVWSDCRLSCNCVCSCGAGPLSSGPPPGAAPEGVQLPFSRGPLPPPPGSSLPPRPGL